MNEITKQDVENWESDKALPPSIEQLGEILEVPPGWLLFGSELEAFSSLERQIIREKFSLIERVYRKGYEDGQRAVGGES